MKDVAASIYRRDGWLCRWCECPVIFAPAMKVLERLIRRREFNGPLAYYHANWARRKAPLLDHLGAEIDHVTAHSGGGKPEESNLVTSCHKCNLRKGNLTADDFMKRAPRRLVKGRYGEPQHWDGLSTLFVLLGD
jgi:5-methylcytosine-specific restriction endonuclease McrA